jgi:hypothetical protein
MSIVQRLTEGIVNRDLSAEGAALINKWEQTGLLEGISDDTQRVLPLLHSHLYAVYSVP